MNGMAWLTRYLIPDTRHLNGPAERHSLSGVGRATVARGDVAQAVAAFNADHPILEVFDGHDLKRIGKEHHGACPLCGGDDRFTVWPAEGRAWCRQCKQAGDSLSWSMRLDGYDPNTRGETARYLRDKGYLQPHQRPQERKPARAPAPTPSAINTGTPALSEYETEWLAEREAILIVDAGLSEADARRQARRLLAVIQDRERRADA